MFFFHSVKSDISNQGHFEFFIESSVFPFLNLLTFPSTLSSATSKQRGAKSNPSPREKKFCGFTLPRVWSALWPNPWQFSSSQQERKWLSRAVLNSPSTGRKSSLNEAVIPIGHAVKAHQSSHPLIRLQYFQHPFTGKKAKSGITLVIKQAYGDEDSAGEVR